MNITIEEFQKLDIRIGTIVKAEVPKWSHWVMKLIVEFDPEIGERTIFAGIMHHYNPQELEGKQSLFIVNLEPKKIGPEGDFSPEEVDMAINQGYVPISLGKSRLRTETAGIVACHTINLVNRG